MALFTIENEFRYEITRKIFEGGMGIVYEAEQHGGREFVKRVAIKIIRPNYASQKMFIENFIGEAKLVADLIHTNIVQTYHLGETNGMSFIAMELIRGVNLEQFTQQLADKRRVLPKELAVFITSRIARGLAYAHAKTDKNGKPLGIVHRDVSFKNIMIAFEGDVKLTDFGIAKARGFLTDQEGEVVAGKPDYMSPEQADFQITDRRSDLFSAGVVLAHLLLGRNIFKGTTPEESRQRILNQPIPDFRALDPRIDDRLNDILHHCLVHDPNRRYATADLLMHDLEYYIYREGYGPTNETLGKFIRELFGQETVKPSPADPQFKTIVLEENARLKQKMFERMKRASSSIVKLGLLQTGCSANSAANLQQTLALAARAAQSGAQIICTQELFRSQYFCQREDHANFQLAETIPGPSTDAFCQLAKQHRVVIIASLFEKRAAGVYHNTAAIIDADGSLLGRYRKMHIPDDPLFHEKFYFTPGDLGFQTWPTRYGKIGVLICWDQWYPEAARLTAMQGAEILFYPTAIGWHPAEKEKYGQRQHAAWETIQRSHAIANGCYVAAVNRIGHEQISGVAGDGLEFWGQSFVAGTSGEILAKAGADKEEILIVPVDLAAVDTTRTHWPFLRDRRIDAYGNLTKRLVD